jgi:ABC-type branched-subunit amino acid transport system permease subunit
VVILCVVSYVVVRYWPRDFTPSMAAITGGLVFIGPLLVILLVFIYKWIVGMWRDHNLDDDTHSSDDIFS